MFNTMVLPHLDYCCTLWGTTSDTNIGKIQKNQNRGMHIILQCHPRTHHRHAFKPNMVEYYGKQRIMFRQLSWYSNYAFRNSKLHVSLLGPYFTSAR